MSKSTSVYLNSAKKFPLSPESKTHYEDRMRACGENGLYGLTNIVFVQHVKARDQTRSTTNGNSINCHRTFASAQVAKSKAVESCFPGFQIHELAAVDI